MICGSTVLVMAGQGIVAPVLPLFADAFGVSTAAIGLTLAMFGLARLVLNVPMGLVADRFGRRPLLVGGPILSAVGMVGSGWAPEFWVLLAWRFVAGAGSAAYMTGAQIYLIDISTPANRARHVAVNQSALLVGVSLGPGLGGVVAEVAGLRAPFFLVGLSAGVAALYAWFRLPETRAVAGDAATTAAAGGIESTTGSRKRRAWQFARSRNFVAVGIVTMAIFMVRTGPQATLVPLLADERFGLGPAQIGALFLLAGVVGLILIVPAAWIADRFGRKRAIVPTGLVAAAGILIVAGSSSVRALALGVMVIAMGSGVAGPAPAAYVADIAPPDLRGVAMGLYRTTGDLGFLVAPPVVGWLADAFSIGTAMVVSAVVVTASSLWFWVAATEQRQVTSITAALPSPGS
jgi:MFS transporter, DHA1 family, multidrug resistance protein